MIPRGRNGPKPVSMRVGNEYCNKAFAPLEWDEEDAHRKTNSSSRSSVARITKLTPNNRKTNLLQMNQRFETQNTVLRSFQGDYTQRHRRQMLVKAWKSRTFKHCWCLGASNGAPTLEEAWSIFKRLSIETPGVLFLDMYSRDVSMHLYNNF